VASTAEAAWQALCTHPADAPLVHVDHGHRFHTPADTDGFLKRKNKTPSAPALTAEEEAFIAKTNAFLLDPDAQRSKFRDLVHSKLYRDDNPLFTTNVAKEALRKALEATKDVTYDSAAMDIIKALNAFCCNVPVHSSHGGARR
jgi:hypothetical protein